MANVLLVADEVQIRRFLCPGFERAGFSVVEAQHVAAALRAAVMNELDLVVLDVDLPDARGSEVLKRLRSWSNVPVIVLSRNDRVQAKVRLFQLGADDYLVKPFGMAELLARSRAALRRSAPAGVRRPLVNAGPLSIDLASRAVTLASRRVRLTRNEYALLAALAAHVGLVVTHRQLMEEVWGSLPSNIQYLRLLVRKLRQKVEIDPSRPALIVSESGVGYRLDPTVVEESAAGRPILANARCR